MALGILDNRVSEPLGSESAHRWDRGGSEDTAGKYWHLRVCPQRRRGRQRLGRSQGGGEPSLFIVPQPPGPRSPGKALCGGQQHRLPQPETPGRVPSSRAFPGLRGRGQWVTNVSLIRPQGPPGGAALACTSGPGSSSASQALD